MVACSEQPGAPLHIAPSLHRDDGGGRPTVVVDPGATGYGAAKTIQEGINLVPAGGRVRVVPGTYHEALVIDKGLTLDVIGRERDEDDDDRSRGHGPGYEVIVAPPGEPTTAIEVATPEPVTIRGLTVHYGGLNGIRGNGQVDVTIDRTRVKAITHPLGAGSLVAVVNDPATGGRARLMVRKSFIDGNTVPSGSLTSAFPENIGIRVQGDVNALIEGSVIRRTGGACIVVVTREDLGGETNADIVNNHLDECYPQGRTASLLVTTAGDPSESQPVTATGEVNIIGNTIRNSRASCLPAAAIAYGLLTGRIEHNRIVRVVQPCATPSVAHGPAAIFIGDRREFMPPATPRVRFNDIVGNVQAGLRVGPHQTSPINARCNWWGSADGPSGVGPGSGDAVWSDLDAVTPVFDPFATQPIAKWGRPRADARTGWHVAPTGSPAGDGSPCDPWDLPTALDHPPVVEPGDTIWLRQGTYTGNFTSRLNGTASHPIVVRQYPGERSTLEWNSAVNQATLTVSGSHTWFWGFEIVGHGPTVHYGAQSTANAIDNRAPGTKLIHLVVHDHGASGLTMWMEAVDGEVYGCIAYNNGGMYDDGGPIGHNLYAQNAGPSLQRIRDNIFFSPYHFNVQIYGQERANQLIQNYVISGNILFNGGASQDPPSYGGADLFIGGSGIAASGITIDGNYTYHPVSGQPGLGSADIGYFFTSGNHDVVFTNNYIIGELDVFDWVTAAVAGNTFYQPGTSPLVLTRGSVANHAWNSNTFYGDPTAAQWVHLPNDLTDFVTWQGHTGLNPGSYGGLVPTGVKVAVRPSQYEPGRANIVVYNWDQLSTVSVDVSGVLNAGDAYVVTNVQDFFGEGVASGTYRGGALQLPMAGIAPPTPLGLSSTPAPVTGPTFNAFVLLKKPLADRGDRP